MDQVEDDAPEATKKLAENLRKIRDTERRDAYTIIQGFWKFINYKSILILDAFFAKVIDECFELPQDADIVLMAFGLLKGYEYQKMSLLERRKKYLKESYYLKTHTYGKIKVFDDASEEEQKKMIDNFRKNGEDKRIYRLATFLKEKDVRKCIKSVENDIRNSEKPTVNLREPSYITQDVACKHNSCSGNLKTGVNNQILNDEQANLPPVEELFPTAQEIVLDPGEIFELKVAIIPKEAAYAPLTFLSKNPEIVTVSPNGMLQAKKKSEENGQESEDYRTTSIIIWAESGVSTKKLVTVDFTAQNCNLPISDINSFVPTFRIEQSMRLAGGTKDDWSTKVNASIGDKVEIQVKYTNISDKTREDVMIKDLLPKSLRYVPGTTTLYNTNYPKGAVDQKDKLVTTGINIGSYLPNGSAYVRFTAEVIDDGLQCGSNTLVNWVQGTVSRITLQDYSAVVLFKP